MWSCLYCSTLSHRFLVSLQDVDLAVMLDEAIGQLCPPWVCVVEVFGCFIVDGLLSLDVHEEFLGVHSNACSDCGYDQGCGPE